MSTTDDAPARRPHGEARPGYSLDVRLWKVTRVDRKARPYQLRWVVGGKVRSATFATSALAESRRAELRQAMRRGEAFEIASGQPESEVRAAEADASADVTPSHRWFEFCRKYVAGRWRMSAAKTREGLADALAAVSLAMVKRGNGTPSDEHLRLAFRWGIVPANAGEDPPAALKTAYDWLSTADRPVGDLADPEVFEDVLYRLSYKLDGTPAAGDTYRRRRRALNTALEHAVVAGELPENPLQRARGKHISPDSVVDRRVLVNAAGPSVTHGGVLRRIVGSLPRAASGGLLCRPVLRGTAPCRGGWAAAVGLPFARGRLGHSDAAGDSTRLREAVDRFRGTARPSGPEGTAGIERPTGADPARPGQNSPGAPEGLWDCGRRPGVRQRTRGRGRVVHLLAGVGGSPRVRPPA